MNELLVKEREIVVPGEELARSMEILPGRNCFRLGDSILSKKVGIVNLDHRVVSVVPLNSPYIPKVGDMVIGEIVDIQGNGWVVDIGAPHDAFLSLAGVKEYIDTRRTSLSKYYDMGDTVYAKVNALQGNSIYLSMQDIKAKKFRGGRMLRINPAKVPRLIGKQGSMVGMIKDMTGCRINVGQNGKVWIDGEKMDECLEAVALVERDAATEGLTDKVAKLLGGKAPAKTEAIPAKNPAGEAAGKPQPPTGKTEKPTEAAE